MHTTEDLFYSKDVKGFDRSRDVSVKFRSYKTRQEVRHFLTLINFSLTHLIGISQKSNRWVDFTCKSVEVSLILKQKAKLNKEAEKVVGYFGENEIKVSILWVSSSVTDEEIGDFMSQFGRIKSLMRLKDKEDGLENGSVLLVYEKKGFRIIPTYLNYGELQLFVRHDGQSSIQPDCL